MIRPPLPGAAIARKSRKINLLHMTGAIGNNADFPAISGN